MTTTADTVLMLEELRKRHRHAIRQRNRIQQAQVFFVNRFVSEPGLPAGEFQKALRNAEKILKTFRDTGDPGPIPVAVLGDIEVHEQALQPFATIVKEMDKSLAKEAEKLPIAEWWCGVRGLNSGGLGKLVGDAGYIGTFRKAAGLWQRMGLRNVRIDGKAYACSSAEPKKKLTAEEWVTIGYNGQRRSTVFQIVDSLLKAQQRASDKAKPLKAADRSKLAPRDRWVAMGDYGELAIQRTVDAMAAHPDWKAGHLLYDRHRVVGKRLLADLLKEWKRLERPTKSRDNHWTPRSRTEYAR